MCCSQFKCKHFRMSTDWGWTSVLLWRRLLKHVLRDVDETLGYKTETYETETFPQFHETEMLDSLSKTRPRPSLARQARLDVFETLWLLLVLCFMNSRHGLQSSLCCVTLSMYHVNRHQQLHFLMHSRDNVWL